MADVDPLATPETDLTTQTILLHAANHDIPALKPFLRVPGAASAQDPETGFTPLHAAIAACGPASEDVAGSEAPAGEPAAAAPASGEEKGAGEEASAVEDIEASAIATVTELFLSGAIWNDLDTNGETPGCLAWRLGRKGVYEVVVEAGVRAEVLLGMMGGYDPLSSGEESEAEEEDITEPAAETEQQTEAPTEAKDATDAKAPAPFDPQDPTDVNSRDYLASELTSTSTALLDSSANAVMMAWETDIMKLSATLLAPSPGLRVLNIGFGMGIVDRFFSAETPSTHHIIEAHPGVLAALREPDHEFGAKWEAKGEEGRNKIWPGRWQDVAPALLMGEEMYDAIYFDTFGEDYGALKMFFEDYVPGLLAEGGRFGFFNGLGADRRVCYDVYTRVAEMDLSGVGMDVQWVEVEVPIEEGLGKEGEGEWEGVKRRYWTLDTYRLPICTFMG
ncbi:hypothetical protein VE03_09415 [Pseudogymnoascus sp. 23342-1-I1]|nr:hypothetical protein VE03_09415 [Pseudogymnoascus sp. 23342-1-I1]